MKRYLLALAILLIPLTLYAQDPGSPDTVYFQAAGWHSADGDTLFVVPGGLPADVQVDVMAWTDNAVGGVSLPTVDFCYDSVSMPTYLDSMKNQYFDGAQTHYLWAEGTLIENFDIIVLNLNGDDTLTPTPPNFTLGGVSFMDSFYTPGLIARLTFTVTDTGYLCLDTIPEFYPGPSFPEFTAQTTPAQYYKPQFISKAFTISYGHLNPDFSANPVIGEKELEVSFTDLIPGSLNSWYWSFGDGYFNTAPSPTHTYKEAGSYDVKLKVCNEFMCDSMIKEDYIQVLAKPLADFNADPKVGAPPLGVQFTNNSIGNITSWKWYFGDYDSSSEQHPYHWYNSLGTYDVTLIVTSNNGSDTTTEANYIYAYPVLSGDSVKLLDVIAVPNQEDLVVPIIQSNDYDSLARIKIPLTFGDSSLVQVDSVSFVGSRAAHFEQKAIDIDDGNATISIDLFTDQSPYLEIGEGLLAKIYLKVKDVIPPEMVFFESNPLDTVLFMSWDYSYMEAGFSAGTLFVEKANLIPPLTPENLVATPLESSISLIWDEVTDPDLRLYAIYRDTLSFTPGSLDDTLSTSFTPYYSDFDVFSGQTYFYQVSAIDSSWNESGYSNEASATFGDDDPPVITLGPSAIAVTDSTGTIYWETDEEADGWVEVLQDSLWVSADSHSQFIEEHTIVLIDLIPSTKYQYRVKSSDSLGNGPTYSWAETFTTASGADETSPQIISGPGVVYKTNNSATIEWTTDEIANGIVYYGETQPFSDSTVDFGFVIGHSITLTGLSPATTYYYVVSSEDPSGNDPTFGGDFGYQAGNHPNSVFCADLDGDEDLDLAAVNDHGDSVSILKNNGDGTFQPKVNYEVGFKPWDVFCADLDGDEDLDLAVVNYGDGDVSILKNYGDGTFKAKVDYSTGTFPRSVFCADLDGDEDLDLAVTAWNNDKIRIRKNFGDGTFDFPSDYDAGVGPWDVFCADLDGDEDLDLAVTNQGNDSVSILKNNGDASFQPKVDYAVGDAPHSIFCADLDGDFDLDLAVANILDNDISILKNNGNGSFQTKVDYGAWSGPASVYCADLDGDDDLDLAVANNYNDNITTLFNNGDGTFVGTDSFTTEATSDILPPEIVYGPIHNGITDNKAVISWITDEISTSIVQYGTSELYGSERTDLDYVQEHQIVLTNLLDSTLYHYRVGSADPESNGPIWSEDLWFMTLPEPDTAAPIILTGPFASWISDNQAQINWTTHEISDSWVYYGLGGSYENVTGSATYVNDHSVVLTNLVPDTVYNFYVSSTDPSGNTVESEHGAGPRRPRDTGEDNFRTRSYPDVAPPVIISGPYVAYKTHNQANVGWITDETGNSIVEYGEDQGYGTQIIYPKATIKHTAYLTNLNPNTVYNFRVGSEDIAKNGPTYSSDVTFTTAADVPDIMPPVITVGPRVPYLDESLAIITWSTNEPANSYMGSELMGALAERIVGEAYYVENHVMLLGLGSSYSVRVFSSDAFGNGPTYSDYFVVTAPTSPDVDPPVIISGPEVIYLSDNTAKISWETNELSSSFVEYGISAEYTDFKANPENETYHVVALTNLAPSTEYHYRIKSADVFANVYLGSDSVFTTGAEPDTVCPLAPVGISASYGNQLSELVWNDNIEGDLSGYNLYRGTTISVLSLVASNLPDNSYQDQGLVNDVTYYYQISAVDQRSNESPASEIICSRPLPYMVGDYTGDEAINLGDVISLANYKFKGAEGHEPLEAGDANYDGEIDVGDMVYLANYLLKAGPNPCNCTVPELPLARHQDRDKVIVGLTFPKEENSNDIEVLLEIDTKDEVAGLEFDLSFDPQQVEVEEIGTSPGSQGMDLFYHTQSDKIKIGLLDIYNLSTLSPGEEEPVVRIKLKKKTPEISLSAARIDQAIIVDPSAQKLPVQIRASKVTEPIPTRFDLAQNYPNPFNPRTVIRYSLPEDCQVKISIYNVLGQRVKVLVNEHQLAGHKSVVWDGKNSEGQRVSSGVYFYKIQAGKFNNVKKMLLIK